LRWNAPALSTWPTATITAIRKISPDGTVITLAGGDSVGFVDGDLKSARFNQPYGVALDAAQTTLYVADYLNHAIRRINLVLEKVDTLAGNGARFADGGAARRASTSPTMCAWMAWDAYGCPTS
jgi:sugar lactone lactonase YvrE